MKKYLVILVVGMLVFTLSFSYYGVVSAQKVQLSLATGSTGGTYYPMGGGIAKLTNKYYPDLQMTAESTGASFENIKLLNSGQVDFAIMETGIAYLAYAGEEMMEESYDNLRFVGSLWYNGMHLMVREGSGINSVEDLKGKAVAVGGPGSVGVFASQIWLKAYDMSFADVDERLIPYSEGAAGVRDGNINATFAAGGVPIAAAIDLSSSVDIKFLSLDPELEDKVKEEHPYYSVTVTPAGTYRGQDEDIYGIGVKNALFASAETPEDVVYKITKLLYEHTDELAEVHKAGEQVNFEEALEGQAIPIHPGAEKYYKERGLID